MTSELIYPVENLHHERDGITLDKYTFNDGTRVTEIHAEWDEPGKPLRIITDAEDNVIHSPDAGRYSGREHLVKLMLAHYNERGALPNLEG